MPVRTPITTQIDGTETVALYVALKDGTLTLAQLKAWALGSALGAGVSNPPLGRPAVSALSGTELVALRQGANTVAATVQQLATWVTTGAVPAFALPGTGKNHLGHLRPLEALDGTEALRIQQGAGWTHVSLATLRSWITA